jgi:hypothetical protein
MDRAPVRTDDRFIPSWRYSLKKGYPRKRENKDIKTAEEDFETASRFHPPYLGIAFDSNTRLRVQLIKNSIE